MWKPQKNPQKHLCWILFLIILEASRLLLYLKELLIWNTYLLEYLQITASLQRASYFTINRFFIKLVRIIFVYQRVPVLILQWKWGIFRGSASVREKNHTHVKKMGHTSEFPLGICWWTLKNPKNQNFEKMKKNCWRYHHFILGYFLPLYLPNNPENQNFEKMKKTPEDIIILHMSTINQNHVMYDS